MALRMVIFISLLIGYFYHGTAEAKPLIEIVDLQWCSAIQDREPVDIYTNGSVFSGKKLYL